MVFGEPRDAWILEQAKNSDVHLRTLLALVSERITNQTTAPGSWTNQIDELAQALAVTVAERFADIHGLNMDELVYLGKTVAIPWRQQSSRKNSHGDNRLPRTES